MNIETLHRKVVTLERKLRTLEFQIAQREAYQQLDLVTEREAASIVCWSYDHLKTLRNKGQIPPHTYTRIDDRTIRYHRKAFQDWFLDRTNIPQAS